MPEIFKFSGGIHPPEYKESTAHLALQEAPLQESYTIPLSQHIGAPPTVLVNKKDTVKKGQMLAEPSGFISAAIHAPTSGTVKNIGECTSVSGKSVPAVTLESDGEDAFDSGLEPYNDWQNADPEDLKQRLSQAGIVGMGGATFPTHVKLSPPPAKKIDTLIINGAECEPCLTADHRTMLENQDKLLTGIRIIARILGIDPASGVYLAIENNKKDAVDQLHEKAAEHGIRIIELETHYPQGAEKNLIYALTKRQVPSAGLPMDVGCVVQNVATAVAVADSVIQGKPLTERALTVTGTPLVNPGNWIHRIGTPIQKVLELAGGVKVDPAKIIVGGPMMGIAVASLDIPVIKGTSGIVLQNGDEVSQFASGPCIACGQCVDVCPMRLMPGSLSKHIENERFDIAEELNVMDCIECGCCAYMCPTDRPLVQHMKRAKAEVTARRKAAEKEQG